MTYFYTDVSEFQTHVDDSYPHKGFFMFRAASEYGRLDNKWEANLKWALSARTAGRIKQFGCYIIPLVIDDDTIYGCLDAINFPRDAVVMLDVESWAGRVNGDHSSRLNALVDRIVKRQNNKRELVWGYANQGDLWSIWPAHSPEFLIIAGYGGQKPDVAGLIGWQYTDGIYSAPDGFPTSSNPFGPCDHNVLYIEPPLAKKGGFLMDLTDDEQREVRDKIRQLFSTVVDQQNGGLPTQLWSYKPTGTAHANDYMKIIVVDTNTAAIQSNLKLDGVIATLKFLVQAQATEDQKIAALTALEQAQTQAETTNFNALMTAITSGGIDATKVAQQIVNSLGPEFGVEVAQELANHLDITVSPK